jgi:glutamine synthetase
LDNSSPDSAGLGQDLRDRGVRFLLASYVDMHGVSKGKVVPVAHLSQMLAGSELCTGAALDGVPQEINDEEVAAHPDPASLAVLPWQKDVAWFASDLWCEGAPFEACSRNILKRALARARDMGFTLNCGIEAEFFVLRDLDGQIAPMSDRHNLAKPAYDVARLLDNIPWLGELVEAMNDLGWDVYSFDHEDGIGQFEIDFNYADGLTMADRFVFFRRMAHEIARKHGGFATFMPKPFADRAGSGAHFNLSLASIADGRNLFVGDKDARGNRFTPLGYKFIAGILKHLPAICAVVAPTVNSYKRLVVRGSASGFTWAPVFLCYGGNNRTNTVRIPMAGGRAELRVADSACNPYLGIAMTLMAGLDGIEQDLDPGEPHHDNMYLKSPEELAKLGVSLLPRSLGEAIQAFESDPLSRRVMGEKMFASWLEYKREEWQSFTSHVTDWEKSRYLKFF